MEFNPSPLKVLHVVSGLTTEGGVMSFVTQIASENQPGVENLIWKHREFKARPADRFICQGRARFTDRSFGADFWGALQEIRPLVRWVRSQERPILHAHSRLAIFASAVAALITGSPLVVHLHALAGRPWVYRMLWNLGRGQPVFNSSRTCRC